MLGRHNLLRTSKENKKMKACINNAIPTIQSTSAKWWYYLTLHTVWNSVPFSFWSFVHFPGKGNKKAAEARLQKKNIMNLLTAVIMGKWPNKCTDRVMKPKAIGKWWKTLKVLT